MESEFWCWDFVVRSVVKVEVRKGVWLRDRSNWGKEGFLGDGLDGYGWVYVIGWGWVVSEELVGFVDVGVGWSCM